MTKEEKKENEEVIKIDLKTVIMLVSALIIILIIFLVIYKNEATKVEKMPEITPDEQTITITEFNEDDAIKLLSSYLEEKSLAMSSPQALLEKYGYATNKEFASYEKTTDETFIKHLEDLKKKSIYDTGINIDKTNKLLILQTCSQDEDGLYLVIGAKLKEKLWKENYF